MCELILIMHVLRDVTICAAFDSVGQDQCIHFRRALWTLFFTHYVAIEKGFCVSDTHLFARTNFPNTLLNICVHLRHCIELPINHPMFSDTFFLKRFCTGSLLWPLESLSSLLSLKLGKIWCSAIVLYGCETKIHTRWYMSTMWYLLMRLLNFDISAEILSVLSVTGIFIIIWCCNVCML